MSVHDDAMLVYRHLVREVLHARRVTTYGTVSQATGVQIGPDAAYMTAVLRAMFIACDDARLPPITAVVCQTDTAYDDGRHGQVGVGYLKVEAESPNLAERFRSELFNRAIAGGRPRFDAAVGSLPYRAMIERHQGGVWARMVWPAELPSPA
jgi:hypothetical protein